MKVVAAFLIGAVLAATVTWIIMTVQCNDRVRDTWHPTRVPCHYVPWDMGHPYAAVPL